MAANNFLISPALQWVPIAYYGIKNKTVLFPNYPKLAP